jgi:hypothetical protein
MVKMSEEESVSPNRRDKGGASYEHFFSPVDAVALFSHQLDNALSKHKKELFEEIDEKIGLQQYEKPKSSVATPKFKFERSARQYEFNSSRIDVVSKARAFLEQKRIAAAAKIMDQCETALKERNKIIRIADKYGWDVVEEYVDEPLSDSTDDATKLRQAEYRAKLKRKDKERQNNRYNPYYKNQNNSDKNTADLFRCSSPTRQGEIPGASSRNTARHVYTASEYYGGKQTAGDNKCFYCNAEGHWAYQYPRKSRVPTGKSY